MLKTTADFIGKRQPHTDMELQVLDVKLIGGGVPNDCSNNALNEADKSDNVRAITGWIVCHSDSTDYYDVIQHWWNRDENGIHFDTTPSIEGVVEYVMDLDLYRFAYKNYDEISSIVAPSLQIRLGKIIAVEESFGVGARRTQRIIAEIDNYSLFNIKAK